MLRVVLLLWLWISAFFFPVSLITLQMTKFASFVFFVLQCVSGDMEIDLLEDHNKHRERHGCGPLVLDRALCRECAKYAKVKQFIEFPTLIIYLFNDMRWLQEVVRKKKIEYSESNGKYGESIMETRDYRKIAKVFNAERVLYRSIKPEFSEDYRCFTQMIWKNTTTLGIGMYPK